MTLWEFTENVRKRSNINLNKIEKFHPSRSLRKDFNKAKFFTTLEKGTKKTDDKNKARNNALEIIDNNYSDYLQVYTDGSVQDDGKTGFGITFKAPGKTFSGSISLRTDDNLSTFSVEMAAIHKALDEIEQHWADHMKIVILTDSLSSLQALQNYPKQRFSTQNQVLRKISNLIAAGKSIALGHIPSHCDIKGNDLADTLANIATTKDTVDFKMCYTRKEAYRILWNSCKTNFVEFPSTEHYPELKGIFPDIPKNELIMLRKMRTRSARLYCPFETLFCSCGKEITFLHIFENCRPFREFNNKINKYMRDNNLYGPYIFLSKHEKLGWQPASFLCNLLMDSPLAFAYS